MAGLKEHRRVETDALATEGAREAMQAAPACFLCGVALRADYGEPIEGGEGVELCRACGAIYRYPALCC